MSRHQSQYVTRLQEFRDWISRSSERAYDISSNGATSPSYCFVPKRHVEHYFQEANFKRTIELLRATFQDHDLPVNAKLVAEHCCRVFCILALLGKEGFIKSFTRNRRLWDENLPFEKTRPPGDFPHDPNDNGFYDNFVNAQWTFCAPTLGRDSSIAIEDDIILPFIVLDSEVVGGSARVYRAKVHENHDGLEPGPRASAKYYAVKTFQRRNAESDYERETRAFQDVTELGTRSKVGMIQFLGGFEYRGTFNIMLEYADAGNLEQYLHQQAKPASKLQVLEFWESLFNTIKALVRLHEQYSEDDALGGGTIRQGLHQDLKPENILVMKNGQDSPYRWCFKVGDLGLTHFRTIMEGQTEAIVRDRFGTRTYGAPETYAPSSFTELRRNEVKRSIDVWSLGAVYSEAAVWTIRGPDGVTSYRRRRKAATDLLPNFRIDDCFHNGKERLEAVDLQHIELLREDPMHTEEEIGMRRVTGRVLEVMVEEMLYSNPTHRPTAQQLDGKAETLLKYAQKFVNGREMAVRTPSPISPTTSNGTQHQRTPSSPQMVLPELNHLYSSPRSTLIPNLPNAHGESVGIDPFTTQKNSAIPSAFGVKARGKQPIGRYDDPNDIMTLLSNLDPGRESVRAVAGASQNPAGSFTNSTPPLSPAREHTTPRQESHDALVPCPVCNKYMDAAEVDAHIDRNCDKPIEAIAPNRAATAPTLQNNEAASPLPPENRPAPPVPAPPQLSVEQTENWYNRRKGPDKSARLPDHWLMGELEGRDHVFLIDDSASMDAHWRSLLRLFRYLVYITKSADPDGVDVYFLSSSKRFKFKDAEPAVRLAVSHTRSGRTTLNDRLGEELHAYCRAIDRYTSHPGGRVWSRNAAAKPPRKKNIYVLTDGVLSLGDEHQGHASIKALVQKLVQASLPREQVGVQFIRFGSSQAGKDRLERLDLLNREYKLGLDVVDTEPANGNVWKMLHGAINSLFDDDPADTGGSGMVSPPPQR